MRLVDETLRLAATDLANQLSCRHLTQLRLAVARGERQMPDWVDPRAHVLRERGFEHEARYVERLEGAGLDVVRLEGDEEAGSLVARTVEAMRRGDAVIVQGALEAELDGHPWHGRPDVLKRVEVPGGTALGSWGYEPVDTKLARETKGTTLLQLALYSELIADVQGVVPARMHVVAPAEELAEESYEVARYAAYTRLVRRRLAAALAGEETYPEPVEHCLVCAFWQECDARRRADDHLSLVAGATRAQRRELEGIGRGTLEALGEEPLAPDFRPSHGARESYDRVQDQARVQLEGRRKGDPGHYELLEREPGRGLARLPEPDPGDVFFDFEGDPFAGRAGLEYLWGWVTVDGGEPEYHDRWAFDAEEERAAFVAFVDAMTERRRAFPGFHVYHFGHYETSTLKRLMGRYAVREAEVDALLRAEVFVDLHRVAVQALRAAVESYSLKDLEHLTGLEREVDLYEAGRARGRLERLLELGEPETIDDGLRAAVRGYNEDDCVSTLRLRDWLEERRAELTAKGEEVPRFVHEPGERTDEAVAKEQRLVELIDALTRGLPADPEERTQEEQARWLLAHLLDYYWREAKVSWWEFHRRRELSADELFEDAGGIRGLELVETVPARGRTPVHRYRFPEQRVRMRRKTELWVGERRIGAIVDYDRRARTVDVKKTGDAADEHPATVFLHDLVRPRPKDAALLALGEAAVAHGLKAEGVGRLAFDLLLRRPPRLAGLPSAASAHATSPAMPAAGSSAPALGSAPALSPRASARGLDAGELRLESDLPRRTTLQEPLALADPDQPRLAEALRLARSLGTTVLPVQGPPGSGKTYTGARMALELVRRGARVGVTATSHKVMRNFLDKTLEAAREAGVEVGCVHRPSELSGEESEIREIHPYPQVLAALASGEAQVLAGTPWLWAREDFRDAVDVLFIDEAGQMALADVLVCSPAAGSLVLLGDPQQLEQPQQGSHPEGTHVSALQHLLGEAATLADDRGLFLGETWRLHPRLCDFTSELFYEDRLAPVEGLERQLLNGPVLSGAGLFFLPVEHEGNQSSSPEEVDAVEELVGGLVAETTWTDKEGVTRPIGLEDILVVAPYNDQVDALRERLPAGARVGTVDKFQGQEAPIVIFSTATSSPDLAPRGMEFLYDPRRLNVATSRARSACVLVGSPALFEPECRTPRQMELANAFCRYLEVAATLAPAGGVSDSGRS